jgi:hypothetical protein
MPDTAMAAAAPQCLRALERANDVRLARADLKRRVRAGQSRAADVILTCPWPARTMSLSELLEAQRGWGRIRVRRLLVTTPVVESKQLDTLTQRQRLALAAALSRGR